MTMNFLGFPHIEGFHNVVKLVEKYPELATGKIRYRGKIKLHGTNASVSIKNNVAVAQSRTQIITANADNAGFAKWVDSNLEYWQSLNETDVPLTVFGEWCGPGIMKGTAIQQIPAKIFAVFAVMIGMDDSATMIVEPAKITEMLGDLPSDVKVLPWYGEQFEVNYTDRAKLQQIAGRLNNTIEAIEHCDPWVKDTFNVEGTAEGVVYYPHWNSVIDRHTFSNFVFKAKGEKHRVNHTKQSVEVDPQVLASVQEFVANFVTEQRLEQGLTFVPLDVTMTGQFVKWVSEDILRESTDELEASELTWKQVCGEVQKVARTWFLAKVNGDIISWKV